MTDQPDDNTTSLATPSELRGAPPRSRRASWGAVIVIAIVAAGAGVLAGTRIGGSPSGAPPTPPGAAGMAGMPGETPSAPPGAGSQAVYISPARQQLVGVRSAPVDRQRVEGTVRTVGMLSYAETRTTQIHTRVSGWVEQINVDYVGKPVRRNETLFTVYSPELVTAQADYLIALRASQKLAANTNPDIRAGADALLAASRDRMRRWNVTDQQIDQLEKTGKPARTISILSPFDGVVIAKDAFAGQYVTPEMTSFKLAELSPLWAIGQVFEYEAKRIQVGDEVEIEFPYAQAEKRTARVDFIYPEVDALTRRVRFRAVLDNRDRTLKPDTYVSMVWRGEPTDRLVVPKEALIDTGERKYVLLALANGYFEPRNVQVGSPIGDFYPIVSGVAEGDRVVTSAQFLIDSETNLMAAMQGMAMAMPGMEMGKPGKPAPGSAAPAPAPSMPGMDMNQPGSGSAAPASPSSPPMPGMDTGQPGSGSAAPKSSMPGMPGM